jgi:hypothetical protein
MKFSFNDSDRLAALREKAYESGADDIDDIVFLLRLLDQAGREYLSFSLAYSQKMRNMQKALNEDIGGELIVEEL